MSKKTAETVLDVRLVPLADLKPNPMNARTHPRGQIEQIKAAIIEFGFTTPIIADLDDGGIIAAGHGRRIALTELIAAGETIRLPSGRELPAGMVPVLDCSGWSEDQRRAYTLADNKLAELSGWDEELLKIELTFLDSQSMNLSLTGFNDAEIAKLLADDEPGDDDQTATEWNGMPEFDQKDKTAFRSIPVHFKDQEAVDKFAELIGQKITDKTRFVWFPEIEIETYADKRYVADEA